MDARPTQLETKPDEVKPAAPPAAEPARTPEDERGSLLHALAAGAIGGIVGTTAMTVALASAQKAGLLGRMPPRKLTAAMLDALHVDVREGTTNVLSGLAHYGFGATMGALFGLVHRKTRDTVPASIQGIAFGTLVWAVSYEVVVPARGIMRRPSRHRPGRPSSMLFGHWVYGAVLGALVGRAAEDALARRSHRPPRQ